jgi:hypothetical protein
LLLEKLILANAYSLWDLGLADKIDLFFVQLKAFDGGFQLLDALLELHVVLIFATWLLVRGLSFFLNHLHFSFTHLLKQAWLVGAQSKLWILAAHNRYRMANFHRVRLRVLVNSKAW